MCKFRVMTILSGPRNLDWIRHVCNKRILLWKWTLQCILFTQMITLETKALE